MDLAFISQKPESQKFFQKSTGSNGTIFVSTWMKTKLTNGWKMIWFRFKISFIWLLSHSSKAKRFFLLEEENLHHKEKEIGFVFPPPTDFCVRSQRCPVDWLTTRKLASGTSHGFSMECRFDCKLSCYILCSVRTSISAGEEQIVFITVRQVLADQASILRYKGEKLPICGCYSGCPISIADWLPLEAVMFNLNRQGEENSVYHRRLAANSTPSMGSRVQSWNPSAK